MLLLGIEEEEQTLLARISTKSPSLAHSSKVLDLLYPQETKAWIQAFGFKTPAEICSAKQENKTSVVASKIPASHHWGWGYSGFFTWSTPSFMAGSIHTDWPGCLFAGRRDCSAMPLVPVSLKAWHSTGSAVLALQVPDNSNPWPPHHIVLLCSDRLRSRKCFSPPSPKQG